MNKPIDIPAYAILNSYLAAASEMYSYWDKNDLWPDTKLQLTKIQNVLFEYLDFNVIQPLLSVDQVKHDPNCGFPLKESCIYLTPDFVFKPESISELYLTLSEQTDQAFKDYFKEVIPEKNLEWWVITLSPGGPLSNIGGLEWTGSEAYPEKTTLFTDVAKQFSDLVTAGAIEPQTGAGISLYETISSLKYKPPTKSNDKFILLASGLLLAYFLLRK